MTFALLVLRNKIYTFNRYLHIAFQLVSNVLKIRYYVESINNKEIYFANDINNDAYQKINYNNFVCIKVQVYTLYLIIKLF